MNFLYEELRDSSGPNWDVGLLGVLEAAATLLKNSAEIGSALNPPMVDSWTDFCGRVLDAKSETWVRPHVLHGVIELGSQLKRLGAANADSLVERALALAFDDRAIKEDITYSAFSPVETRLLTVAACLENRCGTEMAAARVCELLVVLRTKWPDIMGHCSRNPGDVPSVTWFLAQALPYLNGADKVWALDAIVQMVASTSLALSTIIPILQASLWDGSRWQALVNTIQIGSPQRAKRSWLMAQIRLLRRLSSAAAERQEKALPEGFNYLPDLALFAADESGGLVANHVGYSLAAWIELVEEDKRTTSAVSVIERFATDSRIAARHSAAYGAARLKDLSRTSWVRERMVSIYEMLSSDPIVRIRFQLEVGAAEARIRLRRAGRGDDG
jgi:hypothetical protein